MKSNMSKSLLMTALITGSVIAGSASALAADELQEFSLDQMVVTAQRMETKDLDTPATLTVVTAKDIEKSGSTTIAEALRRVPGITDYSYNGNGDDMGSSLSRVYIRGFDKGALVMVNGAPINLNNYASANAIPVEAVERIEVVKGANSVLYGAEALGGVINIITKKGQGDMKTTLSVGGGNYLKKYNVSTQGEGYLLSFGKEYVDEFYPSQMPRKSAGTYRYTSKYKRTKAFTSLALSPNLQLNYDYLKTDPAFGNKRITTDKYSGSRYVYNDTKQTASLIYTDPDNQTKTIFAYNEKKVESNTISSTGRTTRSNTSNYKVSNMYLDTQKKWDIGKDSLIVGLNAKHEKYDQILANTADNERNSYGIYASYNKAFSDKFSTTLGLRGQYYKASDFDDNDKKILLPQIQTSYKLNDDTNWYINVGKAFEMPAMNAHTSAGGTSIEVLRRNAVKPEQGWNYETGLKRITDSSSTKLAVFFMDYKDKFKWVPNEDGSNGSHQENVGKFENVGVEFEYQKELSDKWGYNFNATVQNPKSKDDDDWTQESARLLFNAGIDYTLHKFSSNFSAMVLADRETSKYRYNGASGSTNPDHNLRDRVLLNLSFRYAPTSNQYALLNLNNLLDRDEPVGPYEYYALPFNWMLTYNFTF